MRQRADQGLTLQGDRGRGGCRNGGNQPRGRGKGWTYSETQPVQTNRAQRNAAQGTKAIYLGVLQCSETVSKVDLMGWEVRAGAASECALALGS